MLSTKDYTFNDTLNFDFIENIISINKINEMIVIILLADLQSLKKLFKGSVNVLSIDFSNFDASSSPINDISSMFSECTSLETINFGYFDTSKVIDMSEMFSDCNELKEINFSNFDTSNVISMKSMFSNCISLESLDLTSFNT